MGDLFFSSGLTVADIFILIIVGGENTNYVFNVNYYIINNQILVFLLINASFAIKYFNLEVQIFLTNKLASFTNYYKFI